MVIHRHLERRETLAYWPAEIAENGETVGLITNLNEEGLQIHSDHGFIKGQKLSIRIAVDVAQAGKDHISVCVENVWSAVSSVGGALPAFWTTTVIYPLTSKNSRKDLIALCKHNAA